MQTIQALLLKNKQIQDSKSKVKEKSWKDALNQLSQMGNSLDNLADYIQINFNQNDLIDFKIKENAEKYENMTPI